MKRISDEKFIKEKPDLDKVIAIRVKDGEFYFLAWMENAPHYRIQKAMSTDGYLMDRNGLIVDGDIFTSVQETKEYNNMYLLYELDDDGNLINEDDKIFENEYDEFLSLVHCYERNGISSEDDHDIFELTKNELSNFCDCLRDGDYIFIMNETRTNEDVEAFKQECYEAYQLERLMSHGYSLEKIVNVIVDIVTKDLEDPENEFPEEAFEVSNRIYKSYKQFVDEKGFCGEIFACKEEFMNFEFLSATYMDRLLSLMPEPAKKKALWKEIVEDITAISN